MRGAARGERQTGGGARPQGGRDEQRRRWGKQTPPSSPPPAAAVGTRAAGRRPAGRPHAQRVAPVGGSSARASPSPSTTKKKEHHRRWGRAHRRGTAYPPPSAGGDGRPHPVAPLRRPPPVASRPHHPRPSLAQTPAATGAAGRGRPAGGRRGWRGGVSPLGPVRSATAAAAAVATAITPTAAIVRGAPTVRKDGCGGGGRGNRPVRIAQVRVNGGPRRGISPVVGLRRGADSGCVVPHRRAGGGAHILDRGGGGEDKGLVERVPGERQSTTAGGAPAPARATAAPADVPSRVVPSSTQQEAATTAGAATATATGATAATVCNRRTEVAGDTSDNSVWGRRGQLE